MAVCSSCGSEVGESSKFCTACGNPVAAPAPAPTLCTNCGSKLLPNTRFCTGCGAPVTISAEPTIAADPAPAKEPVAAAAPAAEPVPLEPPQPAASSAQAPTTSTAQADIVPSIAPPAQTSTASAYPVQSYSQEAQPGAGKFRLVVLILLLVIVLGALGGWYFWGVETVVVVSPPDARVFLDGQEISTNSPGRFVISHLSRKAHILKVKNPGYADTIERVDFPLTSFNEWVNVTLVRSGYR